MKLFYLLLNSSRSWINHDMKSHSAAFSYYAPLAITPLIFLSIGIVGFFYGAEFTTQVITNWGNMLGKDLISLIETGVANIKSETQSYKSPIIGVVFFLSASVFALNVLSTGFRVLWEKNDHGLKRWLTKTIRSFAFILILQVYLMVIIGFEFFLAVTKLRAHEIVSFIFLFFSTAIFFIILLKFLVKESPSWKGVIVGGTISSALFVLSKNYATYYVIKSAGSNIYGTAGLILVLLIWIYLLAAIIYYGAAVASEYDKMFKNLKNK